MKVNLTPLNRTRFNAIADASVAEVAKTESQQQAYLDRTKAAGKKPETAVLQRFANYRELVMTANARKLHMRLGPNGWKAVRDHVNGPIQAKYGSTAH